MTDKDRASRPYDIIVWGATGYTGGLVAEYLAKNAPQDVRLAIAGRNKSKLEDVQTKLKDETRRPISILVGDIKDQQSIDAVVRQGRVLLSTAGPFSKVGLPIVDACVREHTDYLDSTGEHPFVRKLIDRYHDQAHREGILIVPCSGFDCVPSDLGALLIADHFAKKGLKPAKIHFTVQDVKGGVSGGTIASALGMDMSSKAMDPYYLAPNAPRGNDPKASLLLKYLPDFGQWHFYYFMEAVNTKIVRRSNALLHYGPPSHFSYSESMRSRNFFTALGTVVVMGLAAALLYLPGVGGFIKRKFPSGSGPTKEQRDNGFFKCKIIGQTQAESNAPSHKAVAYIEGIQDPGYGETAKMLSETALCMLLDRATLRKCERPETERANLGGATAGGGEWGGKEAGAFGVWPGGVLTSASACGMVLVERLRKAGMRFEVKDL
ncbi:hypothetical protein HDV00_000194 [Rhizophlyctis rosea]|nr:hypothetical protein HDV00_000194 [Rhizophlyctis rosea]